MDRKASVCPSPFREAACQFDSQPVEDYKLQACDQRLLLPNPCCEVDDPALAPRAQKSGLMLQDLLVKQAGHIHTFYIQHPDRCPSAAKS